jgi:hypothetical protein
MVIWKPLKHGFREIVLENKDTNKAMDVLSIVRHSFDE